jgi:hypothetical protein
MPGTVEYELSNGGSALIDAEDFEIVQSFGKWHKNDSGYAVKKTRINGQNISIRMHALINNTPKGLHTDHINGDRLDNRKENLRTVSAEMNAWNKTKMREKTVYPDLPKGISWDKSRGQYVASKLQRRRFKTIKEAKQFVMEGVNEL